MKWLHSSLFNSFLGTVCIAIVLGGGLWLAKNIVPIPIDKAVSSSTDPDPSTRVDYVMEKVGSKKVKAQPALSAPTSKNGYWTVEHYRQYEYHYDSNGRFLYKNPTQQDTYLRYWHDR